MIDPDEITRLYDRHASELMAFIFAHVKSRETAEDLLHDTFINLMRFSHERTIDYSNLRALLYKIARNLSIDHLRRENRRNPHAGFANTREGAPDNTAERLEIRASGRVWGNVVAASFSTEEGAFLRGQITMEEKVDLGLGALPEAAAPQLPAEEPAQPPPQTEG